MTSITEPNATLEHLNGSKGTCSPAAPCPPISPCGAHTHPDDWAPFDDDPNPLYVQQAWRAFWLDVEQRERLEGLVRRPLLDQAPAPEQSIVKQLLGEPLSAFESPMDGPIPDPPTALLRRSDGRTLLYDSCVNWLYGMPSKGKSWVAMYCVGEALLRGLRVAYWDFDDSPGTMKRRAAKLDIDIAYHWQEGQFKYWRAGLQDSPLAMAEALDWVAGSDGPALVVIDSVTSAGCPADGSAIMPWAEQFLMPFKAIGATVLPLDHLPKQKIGRPPGPIGAIQKLALLDGAALRVDGECWSDSTDGYVVLTNEKDRHGALPALMNKAVARVQGTHNKNGGLELEIISPEAEDNPEESFTPTLRALADVGPNGVHGQKAMRGLVPGRNQKSDKIIAELVDRALITKTPDGGKLRYQIALDGIVWLGESSDDG